MINWWLVLGGLSILKGGDENCELSDNSNWLSLGMLIGGSKP